MPMPTFPQIDPPLTREGSINGIISSIAAEELSLSHILNTQGEKLQYVLGTLPGLEKERVGAIRRLADGTEAPLSTNWVHSDYPDVVFVDLGPDPVLPDSTDTVLEVRLKG